MSTVAHGQRTSQTLSAVVSPVLLPSILRRRTSAKGRLACSGYVVRLLGNPILRLSLMEALIQ